MIVTIIALLSLASVTCPTYAYIVIVLVVAGGGAAACGGVLMGG